MFGKLFRKKEPESQLVSVIEYPQNYIFETFFKIETGLWKRTDIVTICDKNTEESNLNKLILQHLSHSISVKEKNVDFKEMYENYKKLTTHNSIRKQMKDAKCVHILRSSSKIVFTPTKNGGTAGNSRGYTEITELETTIDRTSEYLIPHLLKAFKDCR